MKYMCCLFFLSACASPEPVFKPVTVEIPVARPCVVKTVTPPDFALAHATTGEDVVAKTQAALVELDQRKAYEAELQSQLIFCQQGE